MSDLRIVHGDCLGIMRGMPSESVDAVVTDPPYGLGTREPTVEQVIAYLQGADLEHGGDFMGKKWQIPSVAVWRECYRLLRPGGMLLSFAGTRTWDLISLGIRAAGFQNRDTVRHDFGPPALGWCHGQGFPKSKALLKPAWEPILMFRKPGPLRELRIDECRVGTGKDVPASAAKDRIGQTSKGDERGRTADTPGFDPHVGRWPANFLLSHSQSCVPVGPKRVRNTSGSVRDAGPRDNAVYGQDARPRGDWTAYGEDGVEVVQEWRCADGCPVAELDRQSGTSRSRVSKSGVHYEDVGGASRYFHCFEPDPFVYQSKPSRRERDAGCEGLPLKAGGVHDDDNYRQPGERKANHTAPTPRSNHHPTVKNVVLMKYLVRLVCPVGGVVLDPFVGSGTTGVACREEGLDFVGIDREAEYVAIARARCGLPAETSGPAQWAVDGDIDDGDEWVAGGSGAEGNSDDGVRRRPTV